jgi:hypothetical protein
MYMQNQKLPRLMVGVLLFVLGACSIGYGQGLQNKLKEGAGSAPSKKISSSLRSVLAYVGAQKEPAQRALWQNEALVPATALAKLDKSDETIRVYLRLQAVRDEFLEELSTYGVQVQIRDDAQGMLQVRMPLDAVEAVAALPYVVRISMPEMLVGFTGSITTEGDGVVGADQLRASLGVNGSGVKVGVLADGMAHYAESQATGDLPTVMYQSFRADGRIDLGFNGGPGYEGTALLEIIHDIAPGATLVFANFETTLEFIRAKQWMASQGCNVVVDDVGVFNNGPYDGTSPVSLASKALVDKGIAYFTAVGNLAQLHYQAFYVPGTNIGENQQENIRAHKFNTDQNDEFFQISIAPGAVVSILLQWNDRFELSDNDYDLFLLKTQVFDFGSDNIYASSQNLQQGTDDPIEEIHFWNQSASTITGYIVIAGYNTAIRELDMFIYGASSQEYITEASSVVNNSDAGGGVISVGAVNWSSPSTIRSYSSRGPTNDGRLKPELVGPDGVSTTVPQYLTFGGSSASVAHVGGIAALLLSWNPGLTPQELGTLLQTHAVALGSPVPNNTYGYGRADALAAGQNLTQGYFHYSFDGDDPQGWTYGSVPLAFDSPTSGVLNGALYLTKTSPASCFGYWLGPVIPVETGKLYEATFTIGSDANPGDAPGVRCRINANNAQGYVVCGVNSIAPGDDSPSSGNAKSYTLYYVPLSGTVGVGFRPAVDLLGFDPANPVGGDFFIEEVTIRARPLP